MSIGKLLIANRGEIAVRIIRACRELGIETVAVYSEADEGAMHRRLADESYLLGPAPAAESYLNIRRLVDAVRRSGAEAVHPGYGFLSESAEFARAVEEAGAVWVGPPPEAMDLMGFKVRAKEAAQRADVPTVPGYDGGEESEELLAEEAEKIGYPILVKASAGGGGRGMRAVQKAEDFEDAVQGARREAEAAFGDGSVFLEKLIEDPRHVEVQVIGDKTGNVVHLYERECSIQRRHQKIVEEAPSPALDPELRESICAAAVRLAKEAGYYNAGTVEFLLDGEDFYFLEMNARLQVEHPVTELVTGQDLVRLQLAVAAGEPLPVEQEDIDLHGSAIETRLYAEEGGVPTGGRVLDLLLPEGPGIRNDAGVEVGDEVPTNYDPMFAKLVVYAPDRRLAVARLRRALRDYGVLGFPTNLPLLQRIADHPAFAAGETTTGFLEEHDLAGPSESPTVPERAALLAAIGELSAGAPTTDPFSSGPWRLLGAMRFHYRAGEDDLVVEAERSGTRGLLLRVGDREFQVELLSNVDGRFNALVDGDAVSWAFAAGDSGVSVSLAGENYRLSTPPPPDIAGAGTGDDDARANLTAPMPGTMVKVLVNEGDEVEEGQLLLVLEAMKMEQSFPAPHDGVIRSLPYAEGDMVPGGALLVEVEEAVQEAG
ncbi:MAG: biotin carboxylase N-terminal domain-containing protein [Rubrobacteraceae bacterium]